MSSSLAALLAKVVVLPVNVGPLTSATAPEPLVEADWSRPALDVETTAALVSPVSVIDAKDAAPVDPLTWAFCVVAVSEYQVVTAPLLFCSERTPNPLSAKRL